MYIIKKIFNNNIALVKDKHGNELILLGSGIAFQKREGDTIDEDKIDKRFILDSSELQLKFYQLFDEIPVSTIDLTVKLVEEAELELGVEFNSMIYVGLSDHIRYAIDRVHKGIDMPNAMLWEIRRFYPNEYKAAANAIETINYYENVWLSDNEIGYIALHFVNAQSGNSAMNLTIELTGVMMDIMKIIQLHFKIELDQNSLSYTRFATHISYLIRRIKQGEISKSEDGFIFDQMKSKYPNCYQCVQQISNYLKIKTNVLLTKEEIVYFMIHVNRVVEQSIQSKGEKDGL